MEQHFVCTHAAMCRFSTFSKKYSPGSMQMHIFEIVLRCGVIAQKSL